MERNFYKLFTLKSVFVLLFIFTGTHAFSRNLSWSNGGGDQLWSNPDNWDGGIVPGKGDYVEINDAGTVYLDVTDTIYELSLIGDCTLEFQNSNGLCISNLLTFMSNFMGTKPVLNLRTGILKIKKGVGDGTMNCGTGNLIVDENFEEYFQINGDTGTITTNGASSLYNLYTCNNLVINSTTCQLANNININGNLSGTGTLNTNGQTVYLKGNMSIRNLDAGSSTFVLMGERPQHIGNNDYTFYYLQNSNDSGTILTGDIRIDGVLDYGPWWYGYSDPSWFFLNGYDLTLGELAYITNSDQGAGYIVTDGGAVHVKAYANSNLTFYIGPSINAYTPVTISSDSSTYFSLAVDNLTAVTSHAVDAVWNITPASDVTNFTANLNWNGSLELPSFDRYNMYVYSRNNPGAHWSPLSPLTSASGADPFYFDLDPMSLSGSTTYQFSVGDDYSPLPVELVSFTVEGLDNENILHWNTASEINNDRFVIERSTDARNWNEIGNIPGHGTTNSPQIYSYNDLSANSLSSSTVYYRLKQVDYNGAFEYSDIRKIQTIKRNNDIKMYPNPATDILNLSFGNNDSKTISIYSMNGECIYTVSCSGLRKQIDINALRTGMYLLKICSSNEVSTQVFGKE